MAALAKLIPATILSLLFLTAAIGATVTSAEAGPRRRVVVVKPRPAPVRVVVKDAPKRAWVAGHWKQIGPRRAVWVEGHWTTR